MLVGILSILAAAGLTLVDQLIKLWATVELLPVGSKPFIPHVLEFYYLLNDGMSFSMLSGKRTLLVIVTGVMLAVLAGMLLLRKMPRLERAAWILVVGGGVGNLIDRIRTGVVVDYLNCLFINFPVFNFADVCICVGVGLLVLSLLLDMRLGEGSGCPIAFQILKAACAVMNGMGTFAEAAIQDDYLEPIRAQDSFTVNAP